MEVTYGGGGGAAGGGGGGGDTSPARRQVLWSLEQDGEERNIWWASGLLTQGVPRVPQDPLAPRRGPLGPSPDRESAIGNAPALVPGPLARLRDLQLLTELAPQVGVHARGRVHRHACRAAAGVARGVR
jgi:hypothetical protein